MNKQRFAVSFEAPGPGCDDPECPYLQNGYWWAREEQSFYGPFSTQKEAEDKVTQLRRYFTRQQDVEASTNFLRTRQALC